MGAARSARRPHGRHRFAAVRTEPGAVRVVDAHVRGPELARRGAHRGAPAGLRGDRAAGARPPRAPPLRRPAPGRPRAPGRDPLPRRSGSARHARARRRRGAAADQRRHEAGGDPPRLPERRAPARAARDRAERARGALRDRGPDADRQDRVRPGAALVPALRVARRRSARSVRLPALAVLRADPRPRRLSRRAAARAGGQRSNPGGRGDAEAARPAAAHARRVPGRARPSGGGSRARPLDGPLRVRPRRAARRPRPDPRLARSSSRQRPGGRAARLGRPRRRSLP